MIVFYKRRMCIFFFAINEKICSFNNHCHFKNQKYNRWFDFDKKIFLSVDTEVLTVVESGKT